MNTKGNLIYFRPPVKLYRIVEFYLFFLFLGILIIFISGIITKQIKLFVGENGQTNFGNTILFFMLLILLIMFLSWSILATNQIYSSFRIYEKGISNPLTMFFNQSKELFIPFSKIVKYKKDWFKKGLYASIFIYTDDNQTFLYRQDYSEKKDHLKILEQNLIQNHIKSVDK